MPAIPKLLLSLPVLAGCAACPSPVAGAQQDAAARAAILATVDRFFAAMAARDQQEFAATMTPEGMTYAQIARDGAWQLRARSNQEHIDNLAKGTQKFVETYWQPTVLQRGPVAVVWAPYRFRIDGADSHYGVDVFSLVEVDGRWRIANATWTIEPGAGAELAPEPGAEVRPASLR